MIVINPLGGINLYLSSSKEHMSDIDLRRCSTEEFSSIKFHLPIYREPGEAESPRSLHYGKRPPQS